MLPGTILIFYKYQNTSTGCYQCSKIGTVVKVAGQQDGKTHTDCPVFFYIYW